MPSFDHFGLLPLPLRQLWKEFPGNVDRKKNDLRRKVQRYTSQIQGHKMSKVKTTRQNITTKNIQICTDACIWNCGESGVLSKIQFEGIYLHKWHTHDLAKRKLFWGWFWKIQTDHLLPSFASIYILGSTRHIAWPSPNLTPNSSAKLDIKSGYSMTPWFHSYSIIFVHNGKA